MKAHYVLTLLDVTSRRNTAEDERWVWAAVDAAGSLGLYTGNPAAGAGCLAIFAPGVWVRVDWKEGTSDA